MTDSESDHDRTDVPQPTEDPETGSTGSTDERSSENRRKGLEQDNATTSGQTSSPEKGSS